MPSLLDTSNEPIMGAAILAYSDKISGKWTEPQHLPALRAAIEAALPTIRRTAAEEMRERAANAIEHYRDGKPELISSIGLRHQLAALVRALPIEEER